MVEHAYPKTDPIDPAHEIRYDGRTLAQWWSGLHAPPRRFVSRGSHERREPARVPPQRVRSAAMQALTACPHPAARVLILDALRWTPERKTRPEVFGTGLEHPIPPHAAGWAAGAVWDETQAEELLELYLLLRSHMTFRAQKGSRVALQEMIDKAGHQLLADSIDARTRRLADLARELHRALVHDEWPEHAGGLRGWVDDIARRVADAMKGLPGPAHVNPLRGQVRAILAVLDECAGAWHRVWKRAGTTAAQVAYPGGWLREHCETLRARMEPPRPVLRSSGRVR